MLKFGEFEKSARQYKINSSVMFTTKIILPNEIMTLLHLILHQNKEGLCTKIAGLMLCLLCFRRDRGFCFDLRAALFSFCKISFISDDFFWMDDYKNFFFKRGRLCF